MISDTNIISKYSAVKAYTDFGRPYLNFDRVEHLKTKLSSLGDWAENFRKLSMDYDPDFGEVIYQPKKDGFRKLTILKPVDQAYYNQCVLTLWDSLYEVIKSDVKRSFSHSFKSDPFTAYWSKSQFTGVKKWLNFESKTTSLSKKYKYLICFDIKKYYEYITVDTVNNFFELAHIPHVDKRKLITAFDIWDVDENGLPQNYFASHFLAEAILSYIDEKTFSGSDCVIRFLDDYRVFSNSRDHLKDLENKLSEELSKFSLSYNYSKRREIIKGIRAPYPSDLSDGEKLSNSLSVKMAYKHIKQVKHKEFDREIFRDSLYSLTVHKSDIAIDYAVEMLVARPECFREISRYLCRVECDKGKLKGLLLNVVNQTKVPFILYCVIRIAASQNIEIHDDLENFIIEPENPMYLIKEYIYSAPWTSSSYIKRWQKFSSLSPEIVSGLDFLNKNIQVYINNGPDAIWKF